MNNIIKRDFYTAPELAKELGISRVSLFYRLHNGSIKGQKFGRNFIIFKRDIDIAKIKSILRK